MLRIEARNLLDNVIVTVRCHHGWQDKTGHTLAAEIVDCQGEDSDQLAVCVQDALNHVLKDRSRHPCITEQDQVEVLPS